MYYVDFQSDMFVLTNFYQARVKNRFFHLLPKTFYDKNMIICLFHKDKTHIFVSVLSLTKTNQTKLYEKNYFIIVGTVFLVADVRNGAGLCPHGAEFAIAQGV